MAERENQIDREAQVSLFLAKVSFIGFDLSYVSLCASKHNG